MLRIGAAVVAALVATGCKKRPKPLECPASIAVTVDWPGASPPEVEALVVRPIEEALSRLAAIKSIHALAAEGAASIEIAIAGDPDAVSPQVFAALEQLRGLPADAGIPTVARVARLESMTLAIGPADAARAAAIEEALGHVPGVRGVTGFGARAPELRVEIDPARMASLRIEPDRVARAVRAHAGPLAEAVVSDGGAPVIKLGEIAAVVESFAASPAVYSGGERVALFAISHGDAAPDPAALAAAGATRVSPPIRASSCPRGVARRFSVTTAWSFGSAARLAARLSTQPVVVLDGVDLADRGDPPVVEVFALEDTEAVRQALREVPGLALVPGGPTVEVAITAEAGEVRIAAARAVEKAARLDDRVAGVEMSPRLDAEPEILVRIDREAAARYGISGHAVAQAVRRARFGEIAAIRRRDGAPLPVRVVVKTAGDMTDAADIGRVPMLIDGALVPLESVADFERGEPAAAIARRDGQRLQRVRVILGDAGARNAVVEAIKAAVAGVDAAIEVTVGAPI